MGVKVVYEPEIGRYVVQGYVTLSTFSDSREGHWSDLGAYDSLRKAVRYASTLQDNLPVPMYRVIDRGTDEAK